MLNYSLYNSGKAIEGYTVNGKDYTILDNQCKDLPADVAEVLMEVFPQLEKQGQADDGVSVETKSVADLEAERIKLEEEKESLTAKEKFENDLSKGIGKCFCSICDREFKNKAGLSNHLKSHE